MIFSPYSRQEEKVSWFPWESHCISREVKKAPAKSAKKHLIPFLGVLTGLKEQWSKKGETVPLHQAYVQLGTIKA